MVQWQDLVRLPDTELARIDIAAMNLACAEGLPGADRIDWNRCLRTLDDWAAKCKRFTDGVMPHFCAGRGDYPKSEPRFRIQALITHLQGDLGLKYHPQRIHETAIFQPEDSFVYGAIQGEGGTCGSLPIVFTAVGRRLGYPLMLAGTRNHLYFRWDAQPVGDSFNVEASGQGVSYFEDEHYRTGRYSMPSETVKACGYLESLSPREELASFLCQRGECWMKEKNYREAVQSYAWANEMDPRRGQHFFLTNQAMVVWKESLKLRLPPSRYFPQLDLGLPPTQFRNLPRQAEREMIAMMVTEGLIENAEFNRRWWMPLRIEPNRRPEGLEDRLRIDFSWEGSERGTQHQF